MDGSDRWRVGHVAREPRARGRWGEGGWAAVVWGRGGVGARLWVSVKSGNKWEVGEPH